MALKNSTGGTGQTNGKNGWVKHAFLLLQQATPVTLVLGCAIGYLLVSYLLGQLQVERERTHKILEAYMLEQKAHLALAKRCHPNE